MATGRHQEQEKTSHDHTNPKTENSVRTKEQRGHMHEPMRDK